jgi:hypothetical protein
MVFGLAFHYLAQLEWKVSIDTSGNSVIFSLITVLLLGCALVFASEAKIEIEAKISFRLEAKKGMISLVLHRSETSKISLYLLLVIVWGSVRGWYFKVF